MIADTKHPEVQDPRKWKLEKEVLVFKITTQYENKLNREKYYKIQDLLSAGIVKQSYINTVKTYTLNREKIKFKKIGKLSLEDIFALDKFINKH